MAKNTTSTAAAPVEFSAEALGFNETEIRQAISEMFTGYVNDITNPQFQQIVANLAADSMRVAQMRAKGTRQALIDEAMTSIRARLSSVTQIPGLMASGRQGMFLAFAGRVVNGLISYGFVALRAAAGLPPVVPPNPEGGGS